MDEATRTRLTLVYPVSGFLRQLIDWAPRPSSTLPSRGPLPRWAPGPLSRRSRGLGRATPPGHRARGHGRSPRRARRPAAGGTDRPRCWLEPRHSRSLMDPDRAPPSLPMRPAVTRPRPPRPPARSAPRALARARKHLASWVVGIPADHGVVFSDIASAAQAARCAWTGAAANRQKT
jgi:hypothetical protein